MLFCQLSCWEGLATSIVATNQETRRGRIYGKAAFGEAD